MNPGLAVKLRPTSAWRIGHESGARNRVDASLRSDALYSAVTSAMARLGRLEDWLAATAGAAVPQVSFSSCFPFIEEYAYVAPPRSLWPPETAARNSRVRWSGARFVPLELVRALAAGERIDEGQWTVDGASQCLTPAGRPGPFRVSVRSGAAVDRITGAPERHTVACAEFRPGCGLWAMIAFASDDARKQWEEPVKAAFRLLADSGFGGERSRGWGRAEQPEFIEGELPGMILPARSQAEELEPEPAAEFEPELTAGEAAVLAEPEIAPFSEPGGEPEPEPSPDEAPVAEDAPAETVAAPLEIRAEAEAATSDEPAAESSPAVEPAIPLEPEPEAEPEPEPAAPAPAPFAAPIAPGFEDAKPYWLLSLYSPAAADQLDWQRGDYALVARTGRIESPVRSGELKLEVNLLREGSVVYAVRAPVGAAPNVAPAGFPHPVYRAGFALAIPLPEGR